VIEGMTEGLTKIAKGGKIRLFIPPHLAYGEKGAGPIGPNVLLIFEIEVLDIVAE
jgi:FKBP-type peptidyl-prolyl cis-trans isomerase